jgi:hypothetical protein
VLFLLQFDYKGILELIDEMEETKRIDFLEEKEDYIWRSCKKSVFAILFATILGFFPPAGGKR